MENWKRLCVCNAIDRWLQEDFFLVGVKKDREASWKKRLNSLCIQERGMHSEIKGVKEMKAHEWVLSTLQMSLQKRENVLGNHIFTQIQGKNGSVFQNVP